MVELLTEKYGTTQAGVYPEWGEMNGRVVDREVWYLAGGLSRMG